MHLSFKLRAFDKLSWDSSRCEELLHKLEDKRYLFKEISNSVSIDSIGQIDEQIGSFTELIFDTCFSVFGKTEQNLLINRRRHHGLILMVGRQKMNF